jgi:hypothetical protein
MLDKGNIDILYILLALFIVYIFFIKAKETLENVDFPTRTEEELRLLVSKGIRSAQKLVLLEEIRDKTDYLKRRIEELNQDLENAKIAREHLAQRNLVI